MLWDEKRKAKNGAACATPLFIVGLYYAYQFLTDLVKAPIISTISAMRKAAIATTVT